MKDKYWTVPFDGREGRWRAPRPEPEAVDEEVIVYDGALVGVIALAPGAGSALVRAEQLWNEYVLARC